MSFDKEDDLIDRHESFGMIGFNRIYGGGKRRLFGSPLRDHGSSMILRIHTAHRRHGLSEDRAFADKQLIEVELSSAQFAALLTTLNHGDGVPCTLKRFDGKQIEEPPDEEIEVDRIREGFVARMSRFKQYVAKQRKRVDDLVAQGKTTKGVLKEIQSALEQIEQEVESNIPFTLDQFEEATEKIVTTAKAEVDALTALRVHEVKRIKAKE
jgi:hypothetical protein